ncbi:MAG: cyclic nucleotide-binding domain-containing protein [Aphanocapsa lilacina HA4352-LM1]|nr:cyclic nucleotide-binding domain-containing protein [Aphanocapsa lilacina HA4352-LM1]
MVAQNRILPQVKMAATDAEREAIFRFRYRVYIQEMNMWLPHTDHRHQRVCDRHDESAVLFYIAEQGEVVATLRRNTVDFDHCPSEWREAFALERFAGIAPNALSLSSRFMVDHRFRHSPMAARLAVAAYRHGREEGLRFDFLLSRFHQIEMYEHFGYRRYVNNYLDVNHALGLMAPMVCVGEDVEHLHSVGSPFAREAHRFANRAADGTWFSEQFPAPPEFAPARTLSPEQRWSQLCRLLGGPPERAIRMLQGLSEVDARAILRHALLHRVRAGRIIVQRGDLLGSLYVVISGTVALYYPGNFDRPPDVLSSGECFGAEGLLASCCAVGQAVTLSEVYLLVLPEQAVAHHQHKHPQAICQLRTNLLQEPCSRFLPTAVLHS